jgi:hypothetical protein
MHFRTVRVRHDDDQLPTLPQSRRCYQCTHSVHMTMAAISETIAATESGSQPAVSEKERYKFGVALKRATL